jgi:hypothetical protein
MSIRDPPAAAASPRSSIYERRLTQDEIRLICIPATTKEEAPIHLEVEIHRHDRCPEYEALSYTWGGEDNDSSRRHPIYVGPYWDVLLQTKNCSDMIRFLRPSRGVRLVWIDAICINQMDEAEKDIQVGIMARIYEGCRRVVVFLGSDVPYKEPGQHPYKMKLRDALRPNPRNGAISNTISLDILGLLHKRYFSRVWIIQELAMAPRMVMQVRDLELWVDPLNPLDTGLWDRTPVPWFNHISLQRLQGSGVCDVLQATWNNEAADFRDKVFGVHALFGDPVTSNALKPDYSLSCFEVYVGVFAHALLYEKRTEILYSAAGISARAGSRPTWLPDWSNVTQLFRYPPAHKTDHPSVRPPSASSVGETSYNQLWTGEAAHQLLREIEDLTSFEYSEYLDSTGEDHSWAHRHERKRFESGWLTSKGQPEPRDVNKNILHVSTESMTTDYSDYLQSDLRYYKDDYRSETWVQVWVPTWNHSAFVDARTGSLTIDLVHVLQFQTKPRLWGVSQGSHVFRLDAIKTEVAMYLTGQGMRLDEIIVPGRDHLFLLWCGNNQPCMYPILRQVDGSQRQEYMLLGVCSHLCLEVDMGTYLEKVRTYDDKYDVDNGVQSNRMEVRKRTDKWVFVNDLQRSASELLYRARESVRYGPSGDEQARLDTIFPGKHNQKDMARVLQGLLSECNETKVSSHGGFLDAYVANLDTRFEPRVHEDHVEMTINPRDWEEMHENRFVEAYSKAFREWRYDGDHKWSSKFMGGLFSILGSDKKPDKRTHIRASRKDLVKLAQETKTYKALARLTRIARHQGMTELELASQPKHEDFDTRIANPRWPRKIVKGFDIDGSRYSVTII